MLWDCYRQTVDINGHAFWAVDPSFRNSLRRNLFHFDIVLQLLIFQKHFKFASSTNVFFGFGKLVYYKLMNNFIILHRTIQYFYMTWQNLYIKQQRTRHGRCIHWTVCTLSHLWDQSTTAFFTVCFTASCQCWKYLQITAEQNKWSMVLHYLPAAKTGFFTYITL